MLVHILRSTVFGLLGIVLGCVVVQCAVSQWTELSSHWINTGFVAPMLGIWGGLTMAESTIGAARFRLRLALAVVAAPLCAVGNFLAFVITSRTWFADRIPVEHRGFIDQLMHPDVLPAFISKGTTGAAGFEESWREYVALGLIVGPLLFMWTSRKPH